ncbi:Wall-associated receptor kinase 4 [Acorus calamus]|uniref:Wall-associated receptor kinase 4 n=1 Tax=Acorus calamus TaxID=4465 RepID=A0AAV9EMH3_ACOCL|nr:Wall-associated receptor kinase 4 [Acorus calamus]
MHTNIYSPKSTPKMMILAVLLLQLLHPTSVASQTKPGCPNKCGNISIPYPFGYGENKNCFREGFNISCTHTDEGPAPYLSRNVFPIKDISLLTGEFTITQFIAVDCYNKSGRDSDRSKSPLANIWRRRPFTFSDSRNKFTVLGCDSSAFLTDSSWVSVPVASPSATAPPWSPTGRAAGSDAARRPFRRGSSTSPSNLRATTTTKLFFILTPAAPPSLLIRNGSNSMGFLISPKTIITGTNWLLSC